MMIQLDFENLCKIHAAFSGDFYDHGSHIVDGQTVKSWEYDNGVSSKAALIRAGIEPNDDIKFQLGWAMIKVFKAINKLPQEQKQAIIDKLITDNQFSARIVISDVVITKLYAVCAGIADPEHNAPLKAGDARQKLIPAGKPEFLDDGPRPVDPAHTTAVATILAFKHLAGRIYAQKTPKFTMDPHDSILQLIVPRIAHAPAV